MFSSVVTFFVVKVPSWWRAYRWRRVQVYVSDAWMEERKKQRALQALTED